MPVPQVRAADSIASGPRCGAIHRLYTHRYTGKVPVDVLVMVAALYAAWGNGIGGR